MGLGWVRRRTRRGLSQSSLRRLQCTSIRYSTKYERLELLEYYTNGKTKLQDMRFPTYNTTIIKPMIPSKHIMRDPHPALRNFFKILVPLNFKRSFHSRSCEDACANPCS